MAEGKTIHVGVKFVKEEGSRDLYDSLPEPVKATWDPATGRQDPVGEPTEYILSNVDEETFARLRDTPATNKAYVVEAETVDAHGDPEDVVVLTDEEAEALQAFPEPASLAYMGLDPALLDENAGRNVVFIHLDTGAAGWIRTEAGERILGGRNWTSDGAATDVDDRQGHGTMTLSLLLAARAARAIVHKVLGDDGRGGSQGIVKAIRAAGDYARANPGPIYILTGSLGGGFEVFEPYVEACRYAEIGGVMCRWSAGNDGQPRISAPANWHADRSSIAFDRTTDQKAGFSNYNAKAGLVTDGVRVLVKTRTNQLARANGTSFSLPLWVLATGVVAAKIGRSAFDVNAVELANCRDTTAPADYEGHGVLDSTRVLAKMGQPVPVDVGKEWAAFRARIERVYGVRA